MEALLVTGYSHNAFFFFLISGAKSKNNLRDYVAIKGNTIKNFFFVILWVLNDLYCFFHINFS